MKRPAFQGRSLHVETLGAIREALCSVAASEAGVIDRMLSGTSCGDRGRRRPIDLSPEEALRIFSLLIGIEWRRGKGARFAGFRIGYLMAIWKVAILDCLDLP